MSMTPAAVRLLVLVLSTALSAATALLAQAPTASAVVAAPVGQGFSMTSNDLAFLLRQVQVGEAHAATATADDPCGTQVGTGPDQVRSPLLPHGLRTVDGTCNNLASGNEGFAAVDRPFPRLSETVLRDAEESPSAFGPPHPTSYAQTTGAVFDSGPRLVSRLVADQSAANPAAVAAAGHPVRSQSTQGVKPCTTDPDPVTGDGEQPAGCIPSGQTLPIPNVSTDVGLSPPFNLLFALFGQFFDHGIDQTVKGGGTVFVPLADDDPLVAGPDGIAGNADDLPPSQRFMVMTRAQNGPGPDGELGTPDDTKDAINTDTPWVDLSQAYGSHASHQVFLREYTSVDGVPVDTGRLLGGPAGTGGEGGLATWADLKAQARDVLGLALADSDALAVPMLATDAYGNFLPGERGLPQYVTASGLVEGDLASPVPVPADVELVAAPFLTDIAHRADPGPQDVDHDPTTPPAVPQPDGDSVASVQPLTAPPGTYDDELLDAHYVAGDGRVNENIGLTSVHQVFEREHNRVVAQVDERLRADTSSRGLAALAEWRGDGPAGWTYGQRLFQAARLVTEMEYQHIVFEEFVRTVEPDVPAFSGYHPEIDAAVPAEFAHAVYRFGHSMLTDAVARRAPDGTAYPTPLLDAFLNPLAFREGPGGSRLSPAAAAGGIILGTSSQAGSEIDEFVTRTLQDNLLGLPLDLAAINIARGRSEGVPTLNGFRRDLHRRSNAGELAPYSSWTDLSQHLRHPETLVNLVAAYGTHPALQPAGPDGEAGTADDVRTVAAMRAAAGELVNPADGSSPDREALDFLDAAGDWAGRDTGVDDVDLWVGGLAEVTSTGGGMLGTTFAHVFSSTLTDLQDADRFYYLGRLEGTNLLTQVEGTSFAELVQRNTDGTRSLKVNSFSVADCRFHLENLGGTPEAYAAQGSLVTDDPSTDCDERALLLRKPDGTIQYRATNSVDPSGTNAQAVYGGSAAGDRVVGGNDDDTMWGNEGADRLEGSTGDDVIVGGADDDVLTDSGGLDTLMGGPGDDLLDGGPGIDALLGGTGTDVAVGGGQDDELLAGQGGDFGSLGAGTDGALGGEGSDWIEGGDGADTLLGDEGGLIPARRGSDPPGHDVLLGGSGDLRADGEDGDDVGSLGPARDDLVGGGGWDWGTHQFDPGAADDDMLVNGGGVEGGGVVVPLRDSWAEVEGISGTPRDDVLRGDNLVPRLEAGNGRTGCDVLDADGLARIDGLADLVPAPTHDLGAVVAASAVGDCPQQGPVWGEGNILLGGGGSDVLEGRGGDDVIDGDKALRVRISVRTDPADPATEIGSATSLDQPWKDGDAQTLVSAVRAGLVSPAQLVVVREVVETGEPGVDTAVFFGARSNYTITPDGDGALVVTQTSPLLKDLGQKFSDGRDVLRGIERIRFSDQTITPAVPDAPTILSATGSPGSARLSWSPAPPTDAPADNGYDLEVLVDGVVVGSVHALSTSVTTYTVEGLPDAEAYELRVRTTNVFGPSAWSSPRLVPGIRVDRPAAPAVEAAPTHRAVTTTWSAGLGGTVDEWQVQLRLDGEVVRQRRLEGTESSLRLGSLTDGLTYTAWVRGRNAAGWGPWGTSDPVVPADRPGRPEIGLPTSGTPGGESTATVAWAPPASDGGSPVTGYRIHVYEWHEDRTVTLADVVPAPADQTSAELVLPPGFYRFRVSAVNVIGESGASRSSQRARAR